MRLAYLVSQYPAINHTYILREILALRQLGFEIHVISIRPADRPHTKMTEEEIVELRRVDTVLGSGVASVMSAHITAMCRYPMSYVKGLWNAVKLSKGDLRKVFSNVIYFGESVIVGHRLLRLGIEHIHSHYTSTVAWFVANVFPVSFSATIHGSAEFNDVVGFYIAEKVAAARVICTISNYGRSQVMRASDPRYWDKLEVSPLGVDCNAFNPGKRRESSGRFEILCVGQLAPDKGQHMLLGAIDRLRHEGRRIHVRLVGDGPDRHSLDKAIAERGLENHVTLEGNRDQNYVKALYREAELFVLASFAEGVPVVLMEAMAMEIACVATWITGIPELINHGVNGWLVPPGDEERLAAAIAILMDDPELRRKLGRAARTSVLDKYNLERNTKVLAEIYRRRLASSSS